MAAMRSAAFFSWVLIRSAAVCWLRAKHGRARATSARPTAWHRKDFPAIMPSNSPILSRPRFRQNAALEPKKEAGYGAPAAEVEDGFSRVQLPWVGRQGFSDANRRKRLKEPDVRPIIKRPILGFFKAKAVPVRVGPGEVLDLGPPALPLEDQGQRRGQADLQPETAMEPEAAARGFVIALAPPPAGVIVQNDRR